MHLPVSSRTRRKEAERYRKLHELIVKKKHENGSFSSSRRPGDLKVSSNSSNSSESLSFSGVEKVGGKGKGKSNNGSGSSQNDNVSKDFGFDEDSVKDSFFDMGSSNFEPDFGGNYIKKGASEKSPEESCTGAKHANLGTFDSKFIEEDGIIEISDVESEHNEVTEIPDDEFQISSSGESEEDEDFRKEHFETDVITDWVIVEDISSGNEEEEIVVPDKVTGERGKGDKLIDSLLRRRKGFEVSFDSDDCEDDVQVVGVIPKTKKSRYESKIDIVKILGNSIFNEEEVSEPEETPELPQKFTFGTEEPMPVEKTEEEKEQSEIWAEMELALCAEDTTSSIVNKAEASAMVESTVSDDCSQGKHVIILNEEIGLLCKLCSFVQQEIKYYTVPFDKNPFGRSERRDFYQGQVDVFGKLHLHDLGNDTQGGGNCSSNVRGTVWDIIPGIGKDLHPHQLDGFLFLWKNVGGGIELDKLKEPTGSDKGSGCIVSHAPGTGKTRLAIVFLQTYMKLYPSCKPVIIAPCGMLLYWESEFKKWNFNIPFHNLNLQKFSGKENEAALKLVRSGQPDRNSVRMVKLYSWKKDRSVLALSYKLFEELVGEEKRRSKMGLKTKDANVQKVLLEVPSLLVLDEGHTPRNDQSQIWKALSKIQTKKRIILSGTPFQNNFDELFNTICLARPQFADLFSNEWDECVVNRRVKHSARKKWNSLTGPIGKEDTNCRQKAKRLEEVRNLISPFVHIHEGNILQCKLPGLRDAAIILQPDELQRRLLDVVKEEASLLHFEMEYLVSVVSVHPSLMPEKLTAESGRLESLELDADAGAKTKFLMELIRISVRLDEKVLVFSQYIDPLKLISKQLIQRFKWFEGKEILCMDGSTEPVIRQVMIKDFNNEKSEAKVMLASTKACSEGINLVGASRVVLLDVVWNPSVERQAICRAYRLGQTKVVHIYHLLTSGTMEENKYCRQAKKEQLSDLVFYSSERTHNHKKLSSNISEDKKDKILESMVESNKLKDILKKIIYEPKANFSVSFGLLNV